MTPEERAVIDAAERYSVAPEGGRHWPRAVLLNAVAILRESRTPKPRWVYDWATIKDRHTGFALTAAGPHVDVEAMKRVADALNAREPK